MKGSMAEQGKSTSADGYLGGKDGRHVRLSAVGGQRVRPNIP